MEVSEESSESEGDEEDAVSEAGDVAAAAATEEAVAAPQGVPPIFTPYLCRQRA